jgi:hypothetical protein
MHYRNGREAKNGDKVIQIESSSGKIVAVGTLINAVPGNDYCNGQIVTVHPNHSGAQVVGACMCDCLHVDDVEAMLKEKGLDKRPAGK